MICNHYIDNIANNESTTEKNGTKTTESDGEITVVSEAEKEVRKMKDNKTSRWALTTFANRTMIITVSY